MIANADHVTIEENESSGQMERAPLSYGQEQWWLLHQLQPDNAAHNIAFPVRLHGALNVSALERAINELHRRHDILRTTIVTENGEPVQVIAPFKPRALEIIDLEHLPAEERERTAREMAGADARVAFDLENDPLFRTRVLRLSKNDHLWLRTSHHATCDGWSLNLLLRELATLYNAFQNNEPSPLPDPPLSHADFARRQREDIKGQIEPQLEYWKGRLKDADPALDLPTDRPRPAVQTHRGAHYYFDLQPSLVAALKRRSQENGVTLFMTLLAAFSVWLHRHSGQSDLTIGSAIANRTARDTRDLLGFLVNTLALRTDLSGDPTFLEMLSRARDEMIGAFNHPDVPFRRLVEGVAPERDPSRSPLFQAFLVSVPFIGDHEFTGLRKEPLTVASNAALYDVLLQVLAKEHERSDNLALKLDYNADLFDPPTAQRMAERFVCLLEAIAADPSPRISQLPLLTDDERAQISTFSTGPDVEYSGPARVEQLVAAQVARTPDAIALESETGESLSYRQLNERAGVLAARLREMGAGPNERVAICLERSPALVVAVLGLLQSGAAYVPLDASYPLARLRATFDDAAPRALITTRALATRFGASADEVAQALPVIFLDDALQNSGAQQSTPALQNADPEDLAYILYTSGSTGKPKGVAMPHRALANLIQWQDEQSRGHKNAAPRTLQFAPLGFDVSFQEIFSTLSSGGTLLLISDDTRRDPFALLDALIAQKVERLFLPFVALQQLAFAATRRNEYPVHLREVASAGETLLITPEVREFFAHLPHCVLHNHYGPTEAHVVTSLTLSGDAHEWPERPTVGRPISNAHISVLDEHGELAPIGVPGELVIGSTPVAHGYWKRPELTAEKFGEIEARKVFRTGDIARWKNDGTLELLGRRDAQIKVRGYRVELGEIEAALCSHPAVREAVVVAETESVAQNADGAGAESSPSSETRLVACIVTADANLDAGDLRRYVREQLPDYMVPAEFVLVEALPLTPSGKLDRRALTVLRTGVVEDAFIPPQTELEASVARAWSDVLGVSRIGRNDNFFELGGHSLLGTLVISRLRDELQIELPLYHLFEAPTIEQLAERIETLESQHDELGYDDFDEGRL